MIGVGVLFAWRARNGATPSGAARLAVLPFDNVGDSADAYFADGLTDAVRTKLTNVGGLEVIGSTSSGQYRHSTKSPAQIAQELGVRYLLIGKVRWAKTPGGSSRVQVTPELLEATTAADKWAQAFDAPITDVFQVQGDIAEKVARALQVTLTPATQQTLTERPTKDLAAYDAYLRAEGYLASGNSPAIVRRAIAACEEAIEHDSTFALAWVRLGVAYTLLYGNTNGTPSLADSANASISRGRMLNPDLAEGYAARANYLLSVETDYQKAMAAADSGLAHWPNNLRLLRVAANAEEFSGHFDAAAARMQQAQRIDPRNSNVLGGMCEIAAWRRRMSEAAAACKANLALRPDNIASIMGTAMISLTEGDLTEARRVVHAAPPTVDQSAIAAYFGQYWDLYWLLDSAQQARLRTLGPDAFDGDRATWGIVLAQDYALIGDMKHARIYADSARQATEAHLRVAPEDAQAHVFLGLAYAYLGRGADAVREAQHGVELDPLSKDGRNGPYNLHQLARVYLISGQPEKAMDVLEQLMRVPYFVTPKWLRVDPNWESLRNNPRFQKLTNS